MKTILKKLFILFSFILLLSFAFKTSAAYASISSGCLTMNATVNVTNLPKDARGNPKSVWIGCNGDGGSSEVNKTTKILHSNGVCTANVDWCKGEIAPVINGRATITHCSCPPYADGCLKVLITDSNVTPTLVNACGSRPTVPTGSAYYDGTCGPIGNFCGVNGHPISPVVNITCQAPKADVVVKVYVDTDKNNVLDKTKDTLYTGSFTGTENGTAFNGTAGSYTITGLTVGSTLPIKLNDISGYTIVTTPPLVNPVNYTVLASGNEVDFLIQAPTCTTRTCSTNQCGRIDNGCGGQVDCGNCTYGTCGDDHTCHCTPKTACDEGKVCGNQPDGCGGQIPCGNCTDGKECNSNNTCACTPPQKIPHLACGSDHTCQPAQTCGVDSCSEGHNCQSTYLNFVIGLDGIGQTGDRPNAEWRPVTGQPGTGSTQNPSHTTRPITVFLTDATQNTQQFEGNIFYNSTTGKFSTSATNVPGVDLGQTIQSGTYTVIASVGAHLKKSLGSVNIVVGTTNTMNNGNDSGDFVAGDLAGNTLSTNADNQLDGIDYQILLSCSIYSDDGGRTCAINSKYKELADLDDESPNGQPRVDQYDYNLFMREVSKVPHGDNVPGTIIMTTTTATASAELVATTSGVTTTGTTAQAQIDPNAPIVPTITTNDTTVATTGTVTPAVSVTPAESITPTETVTPTTTVTPAVTTTPTVTTPPSENTQPAETTVPTETTAPAQ